MFANVVDRRIKWLWMSAPTRYGKTEIIALAVLYLAVFHKVKIPIVGGSAEKARKIMEYITQHIGDNPILYEGLINLPEQADSKAIEKLKISVSKDVLRWRDGGWIFVASVDSRTISKEGEGVVGEGGDIVVLEEAGLIKRPEQLSKIIRMPESERGWGKLIQTGNCIEGSVFEKAYNSDLYHKVLIPLAQAKKERGWTDKELEEKKQQTTTRDWKRYYVPEFPKVSEFTFFKPAKYERLPSRFIKTCGAIDLSLGEAKKGSLIGIVVLGMSESRQIYELESVVRRIGPDDAMRYILNFPYKFDRFGIEAIAFQQYFKMVIDKKSKELNKFIPFVSLHQKRNKSERIESLEPPINTGQLIFKGENDLWDEMEMYPDGDHVDGLDALEMAFRLIKGVPGDVGDISSGGEMIGGLGETKKAHPVKERDKYFKQLKDEQLKKALGF